MIVRILFFLNLYKYFLIFYYNVFDYEKIWFGVLKDLKVIKYYFEIFLLKINFIGKKIGFILLIIWILCIIWK